MSRGRTALLARVRGALGRETTAPPAAPAPPPPLDVGSTMESIVRLVSRESDLVGRFAERATAAGMTVHRSAAASYAASITDLVRLRGFTRVALSCENANLTHALASTVDWRRAHDLDALYDAHATVTDVFAAIAETGTLVVRSAASTTRGGFLVAPIHIALLRASQIIPDMLDLWPLVRPMPTSVVLITGPSKTADIEGILITGVHGPKEVHIFLIEDA